MTIAHTLFEPELVLCRKGIYLSIHEVQAILSLLSLNCRSTDPVDDEKETASVVTFAIDTLPFDEVSVPQKLAKLYPILVVQVVTLLEFMGRFPNE